MIIEAPTDQVSQDQDLATAVVAGDDGSGSSLQIMRVACYVLGLVSLVGSVVFISSPSTGLVAIAVGAAAMGWASLSVGPAGWPVRRLWVHLAAAVIAFISLVGACASACGTYALYQDILGVPTVLVAVLLHLVIAVLVSPLGAPLVRLLGAQTEEGVETVRVVAIATAIGASGFYAGLLIAGGVWCGACAAIHALMLVQLIELVVALRGLRRFAAISTAVAAAGMINLAYHHRSVPTVRDDPAELLSYLRGAWTSEDPPQQFVPSVGAASDSTSPGGGAVPSSPATHQSAAPPAPVPSDLPSQSTPLPPLASDSPPAPTAASGPLRDVRDANRWGSGTAPVVLALGIDTGCPVCAKEFGQVLELKDLVEKGRVQVRFLLSFRNGNEASRATASLAYSAGLVGEVPMLMTLDAVYAHQSSILTAPDAMQYLPASFPPKTAVATLRSQQVAVSTLLADAARLKDQLGSIGDPTIWLIQRGEAKPARKFTGLTLSEVLRVAIVSLEPTP